MSSPYNALVLVSLIGVVVGVAVIVGVMVRWKRARRRQRHTSVAQFGETGPLR